MTMALPTGGPNWLTSHIGEALLRFNLLPSKLLHPLRRALRTRAPRALSGVDRHQSAALIEEHGLGLVLTADDPALALALLPRQHLDRLQLLLGAALNAPHIRRTIARMDRVVLHENLGAEAVAIARERTAAALTGLPVAPDWDVARAREICVSWGAAVLAQAFGAATPEVAGRARLLLPPEADALRAPLAAGGLEPARALAVALELLKLLEPEWVSSFPTRT